jgi:hypothetical protein
MALERLFFIGIFFANSTELLVVPRVRGGRGWLPATIPGPHPVRLRLVVVNF